MPLQHPQNKSNKKYTLDDLIDVMSALRDPDGGCPWDLEQNFKTIAPYTIEEAYEVADAIDREDMNNLREELGDLLLQPVYHAQMAAEENIFTIHDVIHDITAKMILRHPHVFSDKDAKNSDDVNKIWDAQKAAEKPEMRQSALDGVTKGLPALLKAQKLQKKAAKVGFEWTEIEDVFAKLEEELAELREAIVLKSPEAQMEELGDVMFVFANIARMLDINAEESLRQCINKFERRFRGLEQSFKDQGKNLSEVTLENMEHAWKEEKKKESRR